MSLYTGAMDGLCPPVRDEGGGEEEVFPPKEQWRSHNAARYTTGGLHQPYSELTSGHQSPCVVMTTAGDVPPPRPNQCHMDI